jgi:hypothetical protein
MRRTIYVLALATAVLSACTGNNDVAPTPPVTTEPTTTSETPRPTVAPPIEAPVDLSPYHRQTCALLTPEQTAELRLPPQDSNGATNETGHCGWNTVPGGDAIYALTVFITGDPLGEAYQRSNDRFLSGKRVWEPFEIRTIGGLPAVVKVMGDPSTYCEVIVGAGGDQGILLTASVRPELAYPKLCDRLVTAAEWVIDAARG